MVPCLAFLETHYIIKGNAELPVFLPLPPEAGSRCAPPLCLHNAGLNDAFAYERKALSTELLLKPLITLTTKAETVALPPDQPAPAE